MWLRTLLKFWKTRSRRISARWPNAAPRLVSFRPSLEILEGRVLLSTYVVNSLTDTGAGSGTYGDLRYCITNATSGNDIITFAQGLTGPIQLQSALPTLNASVTIQGPGNGQLDLEPASNQPYFGLFSIGSTATVSLSGLGIYRFGEGAIANAGTLNVSACSFFDVGGADVITNSGTATVSDCGFQQNNVGCIDNTGTMDISNSGLEGNDGFPSTTHAAVTNSGVLSLNYCNLDGNVTERRLYNSVADADTLGGAIFNQGALTINNSTLTGNEAHGDATGTSGGTRVAGNGMGGAIYMSAGTLSINSSTLEGNRADAGGNLFTSLGGNYGGSGFGGGLYIAGGTVSINNSTIADNQASGFTTSLSPGDGDGGGIYNAAGPSALQMHDTILADNTAKTAGPDLDGSLTSRGHNLIGNADGSNGFSAAQGDLMGSTANPINPLLGPLQNNGGPKRTMALYAGSPAIDAGDNTNAPAYDQRGPGFPRIVNGTIDIGAFEFQNDYSTQASSLTVAGFPSVTTVGSASTVTVTATNTDGSTDTSYTGTVYFTSSDPSATVLDPSTGSVVPLADFNYQFTTGDNGSHTFTVDLNTAGYQSLTASDTQNATVTGTQADIQVLPLVTCNGPFAGAIGQTLQYTLGASGAPVGTNYTFAINWGDGSGVQTVTGPSGTTVTHSFATSGARDIAVTATANGFTSNPVDQSVTILPVSVLTKTDPAGISGQMLVIDGTAKNDSIVLGTGANNNGVTLLFDGTPLGAILPTQGSQFVLVEVFGEGGNDTLDARNLSVSSVLVGGSGNDTLYGGCGSNLLIGGSGADTLYAGSAGDLLLSGYTSYDSDRTALAYLMAEWDSTDSYTDRINKIMSGVGPSGSYALNSSTVFDDNAIDVLYGGAGMDWFIVHTAKGKNRGNQDQVNGKTHGEVITSI